MNMAIIRMTMKEATTARMQMTATTTVKLMTVTLTTLMKFTAIKMAASFTHKAEQPIILFNIN